MIDIWWQMILSFLNNNTGILLLLVLGMMFFFIFVKKVKQYFFSRGKTGAGVTVIFISCLFFFQFLVFCLKPIVAYVYFYYGFICLYEKKHDIAYQEFLTAHQLSPDNRGILDRLAFAAYSSRPPEEAVKIFEELEKVGISSDMMIYYGHLLLSTGNPEKAKKMLEFASKHALHPTFAYFYLGVYRQQRKEYPEALALMQKTLAQAGEDKNFVRWYMLRIYGEMQDEPAMLALLREMVKDPDPNDKYAQDAQKLLDVYEKGKKIQP
ncbi:MAG: hypothetical protein PHW04_00635 [Candidatus Wallbacteria bacterium]|nr:hypothetical protein [Candidatus Wallbacteria bacterium]